jgi:hypothetical protein
MDKSFHQRCARCWFLFRVHIRFSKYKGWARLDGDSGGGGGGGGPMGNEVVFFAVAGLWLLWAREDLGGFAVVDGWLALREEPSAAIFCLFGGLLSVAL